MNLNNIYNRKQNNKRQNNTNFLDQDFKNIERNYSGQFWDKLHSSIILKLYSSNDEKTIIDYIYKVLKSTHAVKDIEDKKLHEQCKQTAQKYIKNNSIIENGNNFSVLVTTFLPVLLFFKDDAHLAFLNLSMCFVMLFILYIISIISNVKNKDYVNYKWIPIATSTFLIWIIIFLGNLSGIINFVLSISIIMIYVLFLFYLIKRRKAPLYAIYRIFVIIIYEPMILGIFVNGYLRNAENNMKDIALFAVFPLLLNLFADILNNKNYNDNVKTQKKSNFYLVFNKTTPIMVFILVILYEMIPLLNKIVINNDSDCFSQLLLHIVQNRYYDYAFVAIYLFVLIGVYKSSEKLSNTKIVLEDITTKNDIYWINTNTKTVHKADEKDIAKTEFKDYWIKKQNYEDLIDFLKKSQIGQNKYKFYKDSFKKQDIKIIQNTIDINIRNENKKT